MTSYPLCLGYRKNKMRLAAQLSIYNRKSKITRGVDGIRTRDEGFADPCLTTWPRLHFAHIIKWGLLVCNPHPERAMGFEPTTFSLARRRSTTEPRPQFGPLPDRECRDTELNCGHRDFQSRALPTELSRLIYILFVKRSWFYTLSGRMSSNFPLQNRVFIKSWFFPR